MIRFGSYNICNVWNSGLEFVLTGMSQTNVKLGFFQEAKVTGRGLHEGFRRVSVRVKQGINRVWRRCCHVLPQVISLHPGGSLPPRPEHCHISAGVGRTAVVCCEVLYHPRRYLNHRGHHRSHRPMAPRRRADGRWRLKCLTWKF